MTRQENPLRIHTLMHVAFEGLGCIATWIEEKGHEVKYTKLYENENLPEIDTFDLLIVMGGPMNIYEDSLFPWLAAERQFIHQSIVQGKAVLGICLGSQFIADALGAKVFPNQHKEIGWLNIQRSEKGVLNSLAEQLGNDFPVFHWHGDTYELPKDSTLLFSSEACINQAFIYKRKVIGLQFHLEVTESSVAEMLVHGKDELANTSEYIQSAAEIQANPQHIVSNNRKMYQVMDYLEKR